ncbi:hypothetical protein [Aquamicrobium zhengzhouense]|uniref:Uncharacterized protein n=1 Tax=Aquamicrobium zhengzhouense TaxID=2781738 RepID=A0ABS0SF97_9HYPH|nr:hypothetical protein [Aquamicrobium zhengzhouense]MBI1621474.1 hypothetical protein [Aquamicrobium zhengzhouense]
MDTNGTTRVKGEAVPVAATPIVALASRLDDAMTLYSKAEVISWESQQDDNGTKWASVSASKHAYDEELALRSMISMVKAESLEDVAIQLTYACVYLDLLWDQLSCDELTFNIKQDYRALLRLLHSARDFACASVANPPSDASSTVDHTNPWTHIEAVKRSEVKA